MIEQFGFCSLTKVNYPFHLSPKTKLRRPSLIFANFDTGREKLYKPNVSLEEWTEIKNYVVL